MIKIHMLKAGSGDCFLVQIEADTSKEYNILIDCGYYYKEEIKPYLKRIISKGKKIDRFIITHYDADHIQGAWTLIKENGKADAPKFFPIEQVWLNTFRHLQFSKRDISSSEDAKRVVDELIDFDKRVNEHDLVGDKSARQASLLGKELYKNGYGWNEDFGNLAASPENEKKVKLTDDISLQLLTPSFSRLKKLENDFIEFLKSKGLAPTDEEIFDDAFELYCKTKGKDGSKLIGNKAGKTKEISKDSIKYFSKGENYIPDESIENACSISFILHYKDQKILFTGDGLAEDIEKALLKAYPDEDQHPIIFKAIKMSHHGSYKNCKPSLFDLIDSENFLFSTNSKTHNHPDVETIATIINRDTLSKDDKRYLYFNYPLENIAEFKNEELQSEFKYVYKQKTCIEL